MSTRNCGVGPLGEQPESLQLQKHSRFTAENERNKSLRARYYYGLIFLLINLVAWFLRDYAQKLSPQHPLHYLKICGDKGLDCFHTMGVIRASFGCFMFFTSMFVTTIDTSKLYEIRSGWHSGCWTVKSVLLILSMASPFFIPANVIHIYGEVARIGAGIFLILQLISVIQFIEWWNNCWMPEQKENRCCTLGLFASTIFYIASTCGIVVMYILYVPRSSCTLNIFFITWTIILLVVITIISLHSKVNRGLLSSGIMTTYLVFLCWSAIRRKLFWDEEMERGKGNTSEMGRIVATKFLCIISYTVAGEMLCPQHNYKFDVQRWFLLVSLGITAVARSSNKMDIMTGSQYYFIIGISAIVIATFSTGLDSKCFQFRKDGVEEADDIPYGYGFFHLVFSLGAMYFAMLLVSWNLNHSTTRWSIDVGWASTWVKIVNQWFAAAVYLWKLVYPVIQRGKVMDHEAII